MSTIPPEDLSTLNALRELANNDNAEELIRQAELAKNRSAASARIIGHSKDKGWAVEQLDGTIVQNPNLHTTGALGKGQQVDLVLRQGTAAIDFKPLAVGDCGDFESASATGTGAGTGTSSGGSSGSSSGGDSNTGQTNRHWRKDPSGFCYVVSYEGPQREGDHDTERECLDALNVKNWKCINGACGVVAPGTGQFNSQEECEEARGPWAIVNGKCEILDPSNWCPAEGEKRFKSLQECLDSDTHYRCVNGECVKDATGQYIGREACEAALVPAAFTGGQCPGVRYLLQIPIRLGNNAPSTYPDQIVYGPINSVRLEQNGTSVRIRIVARDSAGAALNYAVGGYPGTVSQYSIPSWTPIPQTAEPVGGCGNPPKQCPP